uniref:Uncharacterized protein n=1 Tax=Solanum lycopersicum TaxID=4081 RepID=A0A3Q7IGX2_SOLLC
MAQLRLVWISLKAILKHSKHLALLVTDFCPNDTPRNVIFFTQIPYYFICWSVTSGKGKVFKILFAFLKIFWSEANYPLKCVEA